MLQYEYCKGVNSKHKKHLERGNMKMENKFIQAMENEENKTYTENNATALKSTKNALVDYFGAVGALRGRESNEVKRLFIEAFSEDRLLALKTVFYARDVRNGLGERKVPRKTFKHLATIYPEIMSKNMHLIPHFGRWDDLYEFVGTPLEKQMWGLIKDQLRIDIEAMEKDEEVSLLAKWLKSVNTSNIESVKLGKLTAKNLGMSEKSYRKMLSKLRAYIDVVEVKMTAQDWENIDYSAVPSLAMKNYRDAFRNRDVEGFAKFIEKVESGEETINASTLYPYNIMEGYGLNYWGSHMSTLTEYDQVLEAQWKALPNYVEGENNVLIMADTSGSMGGRPMNTSVGLAIYFAERNKGQFKNTFMTFSSTPSFVRIKGSKLCEKVQSVPAIVDNTNIEAAFELILKTSVDNKVPIEDMPKALVIISDMEFDLIQGGGSYWNAPSKIEWVFYDEMKKRFELAGYEMPNIVFWNVDSRQNVFHALCEYKGVQMASGQSVATFKQILNNFDKTPYEALLEVLNRPEYDCITI